MTFRSSFKSSRLASLPTRETTHFGGHAAPHRSGAALRIDTSRVEASPAFEVLCTAPTFCVYTPGGQDAVRVVLRDLVDDDLPRARAAADEMLRLVQARYPLGDVQVFDVHGMLVYTAGGAR